MVGIWRCLAVVASGGMWAGIIWGIVLIGGCSPTQQTPPDWCIGGVDAGCEQ